MSPRIIESVITKSHNPTWGKIAVGTAGLSAVVGLILTETAAQIVTFSVAILAFIIPIIIRKTQSGIKITCLQTRPPNSVENHHNGRFRVSHGIGHLETYFDIPDWATEFDISIESDPAIDIVPWDNKPDSVRLEGNHLKSDQDLNGFPITLKIVGEPDEIAEGEYKLEFKDMKTKKTIKRIELKGDPDPPEDLDTEQIEPEEAEEWGVAQ
ncbi:hypothetical protein [Haloarcula brevis]|uniref:hypothetical protein n=1 Tax=Haloarcula brevis TaxID=3111453 RepID=UPI00300F275A